MNVSYVWSKQVAEYGEEGEVVGVIRVCVKTVTRGNSVYIKLAYILGLRVSPRHRFYSTLLMLLVCFLPSVSALHISLVLWMLMCMRFRYIPKAQESYSVFLHRIPQKQKSFQKLFLLLFCLPLATPLSFLFHPFLHKLLCAFLVLISFGPYKIRETKKIRKKRSGGGLDSKKKRRQCSSYHGKVKKVWLS